jgi:hypothetical protein
MISLTMMLNDAIISSKALTEAMAGGAVERMLYSVRMLASHLCESAKFIRATKNLPGISGFIANLPSEVRHDLDRVMAFDGDETFKDQVTSLRHNSFHYVHPANPALGAALHDRRNSQSELCVAGQFRHLRSKVGDEIAAAVLFPELDRDAVVGFNQKMRDLHLVLCNVLPLVLQAYVAHRAAELLPETAST